MRSAACPERRNQWPLFCKEAEHALLVFPTEHGPIRPSLHSHRLPSPHVQRQKHLALSLPSVNLTYYCSGHPVNTFISSITSYLLGLTMCLRVTDGI